MPNPVEAFFDSFASSWDARAEDDLSFVRSLFARIGIKKGDRVLDLGCGTGVVTGLIHEFSLAPVHGLDLSANMIAIAKRKYEGKDYASFEAGDFLEASLNPYDVIVVYNAYPHFVDRERFLDALKRSLTANGKFAIVHSLGRKRLCAHHDGLSPTISRDLLPVAEEASFYGKDFRIHVAEEGEDFYLIVGQRQNEKK